MAGRGKSSKSGASKGSAAKKKASQFERQWKTVGFGNGKPKGFRARWGKYATWVIRHGRINGFEELSISREWADKTTKTVKKGKKSVTKTVKAHKAPVEFSFSFQLQREFLGSAARKDRAYIAKQINAWNARVGKKAAFYVNGQALGVNQMYQLVGVNISNVRSEMGYITHCDVELSFRSVGNKAPAELTKKSFKKTYATKKTAKKKQTKKGAKKGAKKKQTKKK